MSKDSTFYCKDKDGIIVVCDKSTWYNHITAGHPEMIGCEAYVKAAIESPYQIYQDRQNLNKKIIYQPFVLPKPFHTQYLRIAIKYRKNLLGKTKGYICTAFACKEKKGGDILIWERS
jgi:hypothetical protein